MDRDNERADRRETGREGLHHHEEGTERDLRSSDDLEDEDELRVQRTEEELRAGTREREAGALNVRKRVRTDREQISVPTRHEEVSVERVPVEGREVSEAEIGEDEVVEEDVRKEEVDVEDATTTRGRSRGTDLDDKTGRRGR